MAEENRNIEIKDFFDNERFKKIENTIKKSKLKNILEGFIGIFSKKALEALDEESYAEAVLYFLNIVQLAEIYNKKIEGKQGADSLTSKCVAIFYKANINFTHFNKIKALIENNIFLLQMGKASYDFNTIYAATLAALGTKEAIAEKGEKIVLSNSSLQEVETILSDKNLDAKINGKIEKIQKKPIDKNQKEIIKAAFLRQIQKLDIAYYYETRPMPGEKGDSLRSLDSLYGLAEFKQTVLLQEEVKDSLEKSITGIIDTDTVDAYLFRDITEATNKFLNHQKNYPSLIENLKFLKK